MELELPQDDLVSSERPTAEELLEAARFLDHSRLVALLDASTTDIDVRNTGGLTALQLAVHQGSVTAVEALLDHGADIEAHDTLLMAVQNGAVDIVACLLRRGASVGTSYSGTDPLHEAVRRGNLEIVQLLLDYGADVRAASSDKRQPLFLAVWKRSPAIIKLLLARGADPDWFFSEEPPTSLHLATQNDDLESIQALLDGGANVDPRDFDGATPLFRAVAHGNLETTRLLLQRGANIRIWRADGSSPLDVAEGNQEMLELLQGETVLQGPRLRAGDGTIDGQIGQPYTVLRPRLPPPETDRDKIVACQGFEATIVDFFTGGEHEQVIHKTPSVYELLYSHGPEACRSKMGGNDPDFTWYHLPSNNVVTRSRL
jgi:ankyrin repeat protein